MNTNTQTLPSPPSSQASTLPTYIIPDNNAFTFPIQQNTQTLHPSYIPATSSHHLYPQNNNNECNFPPNSTNTNDSMTQLPTKNSMTMRLIFQNVNGLPTTPKHPKLDSIQSFMALNQVDVMGMSEVNVAWHTIPTNNRLHSLTSEWFETRHLSIAWNTHEDPLSTRQIGGVALITTNSLTHQIIESGQDPMALGRWTWTRYRGQKGFTLRIISCYRPVPNARGPLSAYNQHRRFFLRQNNETCPRKQFMADLRIQLLAWQEAGDALIVGGDWNDDISTPDWKAFWTSLGLTAAAVFDDNPQATYYRGV